MLMDLHNHRTKMYRLDQLPNLIFWKPFPVWKCSQLAFFLPMRFTTPCLSTRLDDFVLIIVLVMALPLKNLYLPDWFALRNTQPHTVGPFFNPLMQNKMCMWQRTRFLLAMSLTHCIYQTLTWQCRSLNILFFLLHNIQN